MSRSYKMNRRATARDETHERIVRATIALHDEQGVAATTFTDVAQRAGVGAATVLRHFPTIGALVSACGAHVAEDMRPPSAADASRIFQGAKTRQERLERLAAELDSFYTRGSLRLLKAASDRDRIPELAGFLAMVDAGIESWIREALAPDVLADDLIGVLMALCQISVWERMRRAGLTPEQRCDILSALLACAITAVTARREKR